MNSNKMLADIKGLKMEVVISLFSDYIISDKHNLLCAWENLLSNAVAHMPEGGEIHIVIEERDKKLCFRIEDSVPGFTEEDLRHGTEQFYQGDKGKEFQESLWDGACSWHNVSWNNMPAL